MQKMLPIASSQCLETDLRNPLQIASATAARAALAEELALTQEVVRAGKEELQQTQTHLSSVQQEMEGLAQRHQHLLQQHERSQAELGDLQGVLKAKQADADALQDR